MLRAQVSQWIPFTLRARASTVIHRDFFESDFLTVIKLRLNSVSSASACGKLLLTE